MELRNWEYFADGGSAVVGAAVKVREASLAHPNNGTVLATTSTDSNGMWSVTGLTNTAKDVEVIWGALGQYHRWYKGMVRHGAAAVAWTETVTLSGGLNLGTASGAAAGQIKTSSDVTVGGKLMLGTSPNMQKLVMAYAQPLNADAGVQFGSASSMGEATIIHHNVAVMVKVSIMVGNQPVAFYTTTGSDFSVGTDTGAASNKIVVWFNGTKYEVKSRYATNDQVITVYGEGQLVA